MIISLMYITVSAQNVNLTNLMKLAKMTSLQSINSTLESWGYKLGCTKSKDNIETYGWGWGTTRYVENLDEWFNAGSKWAQFTYMKIHQNNSAVMFFSFPSSEICNQMQSQLKTEGWKEIVTEKDSDYIKIDYRKDNRDDFFSLQITCNDYGNKAYSFAYLWYK